MLRPQGFASLIDQHGVEHRCDTFTCSHCCHIVHVKPFADPTELGGLCKVCMKLTCARCIGFSCDPIEKKLERWEARARFLEAVG